MMPLNREKIDQFKKDVVALDRYHTRIAAKMGLCKSNFSSYYHGRHPITNNFLKRFYDAWGDELMANYEKQQIISPGDANETVAPENVASYPKMNYWDDYILVLRKNNDALLSMLEKVIEGNNKLVNSNNQLVESIAKLISNNEKLIGIQNTLLDKQNEILDILNSKLQA